MGEDIPEEALSRAPSVTINTCVRMTFPHVKSREYYCIYYFQMQLMSLESQSSYLKNSSLAIISPVNYFKISQEISEHIR